jgi:aspartyl-tRNA synthetase
MEMSFADEETVMAEIEALISKVWQKMSIAPNLITPFSRMTYHEAMSSYGSDKPDLRYSATVSTVISSIIHC